VAFGVAQKSVLAFLPVTAPNSSTSPVLGEYISPTSKLYPSPAKHEQLKDFLYRLRFDPKRIRKSTTGLNAFELFNYCTAH
jgi:hypothetical protein